MPKKVDEKATDGKYDEQKKERALKINQQNQKQKMSTEEKAQHQLKQKIGTTKTYTK